MHIERLTAQGFRNLAPTDLRLHPRFVMVVGQNGQGKTNLLEALYVCATGKSFRASKTQELIAHGETSGALSARFVRQSVRHDVEVALHDNQRRFRVDSRYLRQTTQLLELVNVVAFFPDDLRITKGSPEERRRYLDRAIANHRPDFVTAAMGYAKALKSRNAMLRSPKPIDAVQLEVYDDQLVSHGTLLHACRVETLDALMPLAQDFVARMLQRQGEDMPLAEFNLTDGLSERQEFEGNFAERFIQGLKASRDLDRKRGTTTYGPHRADVLMSLNGHLARTYASQGQQRALVLALKLAELSYLRKRLNAAPVLLLDDVSSELDAERTALLFQVIHEVAGQVWLSTTGAAAIPLVGEYQTLQVSQGVVQEN